VPWIAILICLGCAVAVLVLLARSRRSDQPGSESDEGSGGGGSKRPERPSPSDSGGEPSWWPQFERDLADYVHRIEAVGRRPNKMTRSPR
jgi:hypothetical protein